MLNIIISLLTFVLILISLFMILVILMQRANTNAGMGSAFGGGVAESAFGAETTNVLVRATKWAAAAFFVLGLILFLLHLERASQGAAEGEALPDIPVVQEPVSTETDSVDLGQVVQEASENAVDAFTGEAAQENNTSEPEPQP